MKLSYVLYPTYKRIAEDNFNKACEIKNNSMYEEAEIESILPDFTIPCIVFGALYLEAFINDYAFRKLDRKLFEYVDKLDLVGKWLVVPELAVGKKFPKEQHVFELLKNIVKNRNRLVHFKTDSFDYVHPFDKAKKVEERYIKEFPEFLEDKKDAFDDKGKLLPEKPAYLEQYQQEALEAYHDEHNKFMSHFPTYFDEAENAVKLLDIIATFINEIDTK